MFYLEVQEEEITDSETFNNGKNKTALAVGLSVSLAFVLVMAIGIFVYLKRRKAQIHIMDEKTEVKIHHTQQSETD